MAGCKYCQPQASGGVYCEKFKLYGAACRLYVCATEQVEREWDRRLEQIPDRLRRQRWLGIYD